MFLKKFSINRSALFSIIGILLAAAIIVSAQLFRHSIILGTDSNFFMNKVYESYMQQKNHTYNYFQSLYGFQQSGRIINTVYAPDFTFIMGLLLAFSKTWFGFQIISSFLCFALAGLSMFTLARYNKITYKLAVGLSLFYMSTNVIASFSLIQTSSSWASAILPLVFIPAIKMIKDKAQPIQPLILAIPVALTMHLHVFTSLLTVLALLPFFIVGFILTPKKVRMLINAILAVLITMLLTSRLLIGMLEVFSSNHLLKPYPIERMMPYTTSFTLGVQDWGSLGLIFSLIATFMFVFTIFNWKTLVLTEKVINLVGLFFLLLSSSLLPWDDLPTTFKMLQGIQFPLRFASISYVLLFLSFTLYLQRITLKEENKYTSISVTYVTVAVLSCLLINQALLTQSEAWQSATPLSNDTTSTLTKIKDMNKLKQAFNGKHALGDGLELVIKPLSDYLPTHNKEDIDIIVRNKPYNIYWKEVANNEIKGKKQVTPEGQLQFNWINASNKTSQMLLPLTAYSNSEVWLNGQKLTKQQYKTSEIGSLIVPAQAGKNSLTIGYKPSLAFVIASYIQIIAYICLGTTFIYYFLKKHIKGN